MLYHSIKHNHYGNTGYHVYKVYDGDMHIKDIRQYTFEHTLIANYCYIEYYPFLIRYRYQYICTGMSSFLLMVRARFFTKDPSEIYNIPLFKLAKVLSLKVKTDIVIFKVIAVVAYHLNSIKIQILLDNSVIHTDTLISLSYEKALQ